MMDIVRVHMDLVKDHASVILSYPNSYLNKLFDGKETWKIVLTSSALTYLLLKLQDYINEEGEEFVHISPIIILLVESK